MTGNTWVELDLGILEENIRKARGVLRGGTELIFVVKSDAYGHGLETVAARARACGVRWFAVAYAAEGARLREVAPDAEILVVGAMNEADTATAIERRLTPALVSERHALELARAAEGLGARLRCHGKIDTGMGRLGFAWEEAGRRLPALAARAGLEITGLCSHFASSDGAARGFADEQAARFARVARECEAAGMAAGFRHISNSGGTLRDGAWDMDGVRAGILMYGYGARIAGAERTIGTRPFLRWKTRLVQVKRVPAGFPVSYGGTHVTPKATRLGTMDVGYADGYFRRLSNAGCALVGGRRCPVVGRVTMNLTVVDLGPDSREEEGAEVTLIGEQGGASLWADELAAWCETIPYEILTSIRTRDRRVVSG